MNYEFPPSAGVTEIKQAFLSKSMDTLVTNKRF